MWWGVAWSGGVRCGAEKEEEREAEGGGRAWKLEVRRTSSTVTPTHRNIGLVQQGNGTRGTGIMR
eukprot:11195305-Lingulodinium_polyedra.AAC.2